MADPGDLAKAWQQVSKQLRGAAASVPGHSELGRVLGPIQRQAELAGRLVAEQAAFQRDLVGRLFVPMDVMLEVLDQTSTAMHTQSQALEAASASLKQVSELLEVQANLIQRASDSIREPTDFLRSAGGFRRAELDVDTHIDTDLESLAPDEPGDPGEPEEPGDPDEPGEPDEPDE
jgi:hypothetical protein